MKYTTDKDKWYDLEHQLADDVCRRWESATPCLVVDTFYDSLHLFALEHIRSLDNDELVVFTTRTAPQLLSLIEEKE